MVTYNSSEISLIVFYYFSAGTYSTVDTMFCLFTVFYLIGMIGWMIYIIEIKNIFGNEIESEKLLFFKLFFDLSTPWKRRYLFMIIGRKIISSLIYVYAYNDIYAQVTSLALIYLTFWLYIVLVRPF